MSSVESDGIILRMKAVGFESVAAQARAVKGALVDMSVAGGKALNAAGAAATGTLSKLSAVSKGLKSFGNNLKITGQGLTRGFTVPIVAIGALAIKSSLDFNRSMLLIQTSAGASRKEVARLKKEILGMKSPFSKLQLSNTAYAIESVGYRGKRADNALKLANQTAVIGDADPVEVASAIAGAVKVGIKGATGPNAFRNVAHLLLAAAGAGNMHVGDLVGSFGTGVLAGAKNAGLSLKDVVAAQALLSDEGTKANYSGARLRTGFQYLTSPTAKAQHELALLGLSSTALAKTLRTGGLRAGIAQLHQALLGIKNPDLRNQALNAILPPSRGSVIISLLNQLWNMQKKEKQIDRTSGNFNKSYAQTLKDPKVQSQVAVQTLNGALIQLGDALVPVIIPALIKLANLLSRVLLWFTKLSPGVRKFVIIALGLLATVGPLLIIIGQLAIAIAALSSPITLIIIALALIAIGLIYAYTHFKAFRDTVNYIFANWDWISWFAGPVIFAITQVVENWSALVSLFKHAPQTFKRLGKGLWNGLLDGFRAVLWSIVQLWNSVAKKFAFHINIPGVGGVGFGGLPTIGMRNPYQDTGPKTTARTLSQLGVAGPKDWLPITDPSAGPPPITDPDRTLENHIYMDGSKVATVVTRATQKSKARH